MRRHLTALCGLLAVLLLAGCSSSPPTAGGGSDMPSGALAVVMGTVLLADSSPSAGSDVLLREIIITPSGDSIIGEYASETDSSGSYAFSDVPAGRYVVLASRGEEFVAIDQQVRVGDSGEVIVAPLRLGRHVDLSGFVELPPGYYYSGMRVWVPGTGRHARVDHNRMFLLEDVPQGRCELLLSYGDVANYLSIDIQPRHTDDSIVQLRNLRFAVMEVMAPRAEAFHRTSIAHRFMLTPILYAQGHEPPWYDFTDLLRVRYYYWDGQVQLEWRSGDPPPIPAYDALLSGMLFRETGSERVVLESSGGLIYPLSGHLVDFAGPIPVPVTVAVLVGASVYEVVDIYIPGALPVAP